MSVFFRGRWKVESGKRNVCGRVISFLFPLSTFLFLSCEQATEHTAPPIYDRDSVSMMTSYGVGREHCPTANPLDFRERYIL